MRHTWRRSLFPERIPQCPFDRCFICWHLSSLYSGLQYHGIASASRFIPEEIYFFRDLTKIEFTGRSHNHYINSLGQLTMPDLARFRPPINILAVMLPVCRNNVALLWNWYRPFAQHDDRAAAIFSPIYLQDIQFSETHNTLQTKRLSDVMWWVCWTQRFSALTRVSRRWSRSQSSSMQHSVMWSRFELSPPFPTVNNNDDDDRGACTQIEVTKDPTPTYPSSVVS
jgi:hypothetical protein